MWYEIINSDSWKKRKHIWLSCVHVDEYALAYIEIKSVWELLCLISVLVNNLHLMMRRHKAGKATFLKRVKILK